MASTRSLTYLVAVSLDGYIAGPGGDISAFPVIGDHIDWLLAERPETLPTPFLEVAQVEPANDTFDTVVMGWNTFALGLEAGLQNPYATLNQYVVSTTHTQAEAGSDVTVTDENPVELVRHLKAQPGRGIWLAGGGVLAASVADEIDRLVLKVNPIVLGDGIRLFAPNRLPGGSAHRPFALATSQAFTSGVVINTYDRAPEPSDLS